MKRIFYLLAFALFFLTTASAGAQEKISVRTSVKEDYARIVFDWKSNVQYALDESGESKLIVSFERAGVPDLSGADFTSLGNISSPEVVSENPLKLSFTVPEASKVRSFDAKGKVYIDVYNPDGQKREVKAEPKPVKTAKVEEKPKPVPPPKKEEPQKIGPVVEVKPGVMLKFEPEYKKPPPAAAKPQAAPVVSVPDAEHVAAPGAEEEKLDNNQHVISVTATQAVHVAAFENFGQLWFVMDQDAFYLTPTVNGPNRQIFGEFVQEPLDRGRAYHAKMPPHMEARAQGGGLLWKLIVSDALQKGNPIAFDREIAQGAKTRGGTLIWPILDAGAIFDIPDPITGQTLKIVTVADAEQFAGPVQSFVDFEILRSPIGLAIRPKVDDLQVERTPRGIEITRPGGLSLSPVKQSSESNVPASGPVVDLHAEKAPDALHKGTGRKKDSIFRFSDWKVGALEELNQNKNIILSALNDKPKPKKVEDLMTLSKMHLAHGRGAEALGFLEYAYQEMPELEKNPEFLALRGVARAFDWKSEIAFQDLSNPDLKSYDEIKYWKAFVLADLGDWKQAASVLPDDYSYLYDYPEKITDRLALSLAEVNLRDGKVKVAEDLLTLVEQHEESKTPPMQAAIKYLQGEVHRQKGEKDKTSALWTALTEDLDDFYRARAGLALTQLLKNDKKIDNKQAIDRLERLRYAWRGDELEAQINYWLGHAYFESKDFVKGLSIMRDAAAIAMDTVLGQRIGTEMRDVFSNIFLKAHLKDVSPLDAVAMYEQFGDLTPPGDPGNKLVQVLAEHLTKAGLYERAAKLLQHQVDHRLQGEEKLKIAIRLAAINLMDKQPQKAIKALRAAVQVMATLPDDVRRAARQREITLLSAKAYAQGDQGDKALTLLKQMPKDKDVSRLKADIAWQSGYWGDAAEAFNDVILDENISPTRPMTDEQRDLVMNRAIALNLANDRVALANMRTTYKDLMLQTDRASQFELITRPRRDSELADKDTMMSIMSEVDLFKNFLDSYRGGPEEAAAMPATTETPDVAPAPATSETEAAPVAPAEE